VPVAVVVANAPFAWTAELAALVAAADPLLAADGGANHLARLGLRPAAVVGDLDSISPAVRRWLGEEMLVRRDDQDHTDLEKTLSFACDQLGLERVLVLGALGGRTDHALANLGLLARRAVGEALVFRAPDEQLLAVRGEAVLASAPGETWSFWSFDPAVLLTLSGVRWPLERAPVDLVGRPSISNLAEGERLVVHAEGGAVVALRRLRLAAL
jgi:thiamine pyrophosphokinase